MLLGVLVEPLVVLDLLVETRDLTVVVFAVIRADDAQRVDHRNPRFGVRQVEPDDRVTTTVLAISLSSRAMLRDEQLRDARGQLGKSFVSDAHENTSCEWSGNAASALLTAV